MSAERTRDIDNLTRELQSLNLRTRRVEADLRALRAQDAPDSESEAKVTFKAGDKVTVINQIRRPRTWTGSWDPAAIIAERRATVTHTVQGQVWFVTENGTETWRAPGNLQLRTDDE